MSPQRNEEKLNLSDVNIKNITIIVCFHNSLVQILLLVFILV